MNSHGFVIVDWRPHKDPPDVWGSFESVDVAEDYALELFEVMDLPDGVDIRPLLSVPFDIPYGVFTDG